MPAIEMGIVALIDLYSIPLAIVAQRLAKPIYSSFGRLLKIIGFAHITKSSYLSSLDHAQAYRFMPSLCGLNFTSDLPLGAAPKASCSPCSHSIESCLANPCF